MCRARHETEDEQPRLCPSNGGTLPDDLDPAEAERRREEYRRAVADRMMTMRINHERDRRRVRSWVRNLPAESRRQAILARLSDPDIHRKGNAGTRKALQAELERLPAS